MNFISIDVLNDIDYDVMNKIPNNGDNVEKKSLNWPCVLVFEMNNTLTCV